MFCTGLLVKLKGDVLGTNLCSPPGKHYCFWFTIFIDRGSPDDLHSTFSTLVALTSWVKVPLWGLCQWLSNAVSIMHSRTWGKPQSESRDPLGSLYNRPEPKLCGSSDRNTVMFWVSRSGINSEPELL